MVGAGHTWIGPPSAAILEMGSKAAAKAVMTAAGVPVTPGYWGEDVSGPRLAAEAAAIGFPLMVKAVKGGGGKGMRIVRSQGELLSSVEACMREASASFGESRVLLERYIGRPRHIELQVFADTHGHAVYLWEMVKAPPKVVLYKGIVSALLTGRGWMNGAQLCERLADAGLLKYMGTPPTRSSPPAVVWCPAR